MTSHRFQGTDKYVATDDLSIAVNAAIALERPLLIKGEPGTGKTQLAFEVADALKAPLITWHVKSTTKAQQGLYEYDAVTRLRDPNWATCASRTSKTTSRRASCGRRSKERAASGAADRRDRQGRYRIPQRPAARARPDGVLRLRDRRDDQGVPASPSILITSNNEKELPDAFLRRCFFHYIRFPDRDTMQKIVDVHFPGYQAGAGVARRSTVFTRSRDVPGLKKKPSTSELLDWLKLLLNEDIPPEALRNAIPQSYSAAARRAPQERAGCASVRTPGLSRATGTRQQQAAPDVRGGGIS